MIHYESYDYHEKHLPTKGKFIISQFNKDSIIVYQAFNDAIATYAVEHQRFGGDAYDFGRMTWLKPSFLWMMYYSGWAKKENQENVLAIRIKRSGFDEMLKNAVAATYTKEIYKDKKGWEAALQNTSTLYAWETYHDLQGNKTERKALKVGVSGKMLEKYNNEWIEEIINITDFVNMQQQMVIDNKIENVKLPKERAYAPVDLSLLTKMGATTISM